MWSRYFPIRDLDKRWFSQVFEEIFAADGIVIISLVFVFAGNFTADILYRVIDPRMGEGQSVL